MALNDPTTPAATHAVPLARIVSVANRFVRSVHLERDFESLDSDGYLSTETGVKALQAVLGALSLPADRAMTLTGPYGAGKSAFCLFLARLLAADHPQRASLTSGGQWGDHLPETRLMPVLLVGARQPLAPALVAALERVLRRSEYSALYSHLSRAHGDLFHATGPTPRQVADLYRDAAVHAPKVGVGGLLLIIDELGKFMEYAVLHPEEEDIYMLQELAEAAARSGSNPLLVLGVLHQNAEAYAHRLDRHHRAEWAKIGQRFRHIPFFPSEFESMFLVGEALRREADLPVGDAVDSICRRWLELGCLPAAVADHFSQMARAAYPLHPLTLRALPALFRRAGQSHRSIFTFLAGEEPHSFGLFLKETAVTDPSRPPLYMPDALFDYAAEVLLTGWSPSPLTRAWADAVESVARAAHFPAVTQRVLKCIALFGWLKDPWLPASEEMLRLALTDADDAAPDVKSALDGLTKRCLVTYSRVRRTYRLWEGGDVDVPGELARMRAALPSTEVVHLAGDLCPPQSRVAQRHSYETGTTRVVTLLPCAPSKLQDALQRYASGGELVVLCCAAADEDEARAAREAASRCRAPNVLCIVAPETDALRDAAAEVVAARRVAEEVPELGNDRAARRELAACRAEAETAFRAEWSRLFSPNPGIARWFYRGKEIEMNGSRQFANFLSRMADKTYRGTPRLRNELINRHTLSSAGAAARRALIAAMLEHPEKERLGIEGYPPERSIYECVLGATGLHRLADLERWGFFAPPPEDPARLLPAWKVLDKQVFAEPPEPRPVDRLFALLSAPPYGVTPGVLPLLLCAFFQAHRDETTLYRDGTFLVEPAVADFEVLLRRPELFAIAGCRVRGARAAVVERLARGLNTQAAVVPVVRALFRMVKTLPEYAWKTRRLRPEVQKLREAFRRARSPEQLLFVEIPEAFDQPPVGEGMDDPAIEHLFKRLNTALQEWSRTWPRVVGRVRDALLRSSGFPAGA
ncbi:MAG: hypothetical protein QHJ73_03970, partial [Armatimonadota bacterium]|nr:hypothetical protein [Armatimonadota bacterium]